MDEPPGRPDVQRVHGARRYLLLLAVSATLPFIALIAAVTLIDPYYMFGSADIPNFNAVRPSYEFHVPRTKPYQVRRLAPRAVALGSSRAEVGIDPRHPAWANLDPFNFAIPSSSSYEVMLAMLHARAEGRPPRLAVAALDFFAFNIFFKMGLDTEEARFSGDGAASFARFLEARMAERRSRKSGGSETVPTSPRRAASLGEFPSGWNENGYLQAHQDVAAAVANKAFRSGHDHYQRAGRVEGRLGGLVPANWNEDRYLDVNLSARRALARGLYDSGFIHYAAVGRAARLVGGLPPETLIESARLRWPGFNKTYFMLRELRLMVLSETAVADSFKTLLRQPEPRTFSAKGQRIWEGQEAVVQRLGGTGTLFRRYIGAGGWHLWFQPPEKMYCFSHPRTGMSTLDPFRFMVRRAYAENAALHLYVTPLHVSIRLLLRELGLHARYEWWLKRMVSIVEEEARRAGRPPLPLWDFSDVNSITAEAIPAKGDPSPMRWFWEISHFREATGNLILDRVLGYRDSRRVVPDDFGALLSQANIVTHLGATRDGLDKWSGAHTELATLIRTSVARGRSSIRQSDADCW